MRRREIGTNDPVQELSAWQLRELLADKEITMGAHATDHLSQAQGDRGLHEQEIGEILSNDNPIRAYLQKNGRYRAYYRKKDGFKSIIMDINNKKVKVVTFMSLKDLPDIEL